MGDPPASQRKSRCAVWPQGATCAIAKPIAEAQRGQLPKADAITVTAIETGVPAIVIARDLMERCHRMLRARDIGAMPDWLSETSTSVLASFWKGIAADLAAVKAALTEPW